MNKEQWIKESVKCLVLAFKELNSIRARDGAPLGVSPEWFSQIVNRIDAAVISQTGKTAHCHPALYSDEF